MTQSESTRWPDLHAAEGDLVALHDGDAVQVLELLDGALRHQQRPGLGVEQDPRAAVLARAEHLLGIGKHELHVRVFRSSDRRRARRR